MQTYTWTLSDWGNYANLHMDTVQLTRKKQKDEIDHLYLLKNKICLKKNAE